MNSILFSMGDNLYECPNGCKANPSPFVEIIGDRPSCAKCGYWLVTVHDPQVDEYGYASGTEPECGGCMACPDCADKE